MPRPLRLLIVAAGVIGTLTGCLERPDHLAEARERVRQAEGLIEGLSSETDPAAAQERAFDAEQRLNEAVVLYVAARADLSENVDLLHEFGDVAERARSHDLAGDAYQRAAELGGDVRDYLRAGLNYEQIGELGAPLAQTAFEQALSQNPDPLHAVIARARLTRLALRMDDVAAAEAHVEAGRALGAENAQLQLAEALLLCHRGETARGSELLNAAVANPAEVGEYQRDLERALAASAPGANTSAEDLRGRAGLLLRIGRVAETVPLLEAALERAPEDVITLNMLGSLQMQMGNRDAARALFERSLAANPDQPRTQQALETLNEPDAQP